MTQGEMFSDLALEQQYDNMIKELNMKQETLEEVAQKQWGNVHRTGVLAFIEGAKYQAERMYSEEEVYNLLYNLACEVVQDYDHTPKKLDKWFEQFKKK